MASVIKWSRRVCAAWVLAAGVALAGGSEASTEWRGGGFISDFQNCEDYGWPDGYSDMIQARYRPSGMPGNGDTSRLTLLFNTGTEHYRTREGRFDSRFGEVDGAAIWSGAWIFDPHPMVRMRQHQPPNITQNTDRIRLVGMIRHFSGLRGCRMQFDLTLTRRP